MKNVPKATNLHTRMSLERCREGSYVHTLSSHTKKAYSGFQSLSILSWDSACNGVFKEKVCLFGSTVWYHLRHEVEFSESQGPGNPFLLLCF